jgi:hypothetical protein
LKALGFLILLVAVLSSVSCVESPAQVGPDPCDFAGVTAVDESGNVTAVDPEDWCGVIPQSERLVPERSIPTEFTFGPARPNPTSGPTTISFGLPSADTVSIYVMAPDCAIARILVFGFHEAGAHSVTWDGLDELGESVPEGIYRCRMSGSSFRCFGDIEIRR